MRFATLTTFGLALVALAGLFLIPMSGCVGDEPAPEKKPAEVAKKPASKKLAPGKDWKKPSKEELEKRLTPLQYRVTQLEGTERPFENTYWDNKKHGIYVDIVSGEPLFSSLDKFKSGTGWPSFTRPIAGTKIKEVKDTSHGWNRVEVRSPLADSHLGHVFDDGPKPTGLRYCINSAALRFVPAKELHRAGYSRYVAAFVAAGKLSKEDAQAVRKERAILAGGCFWGMEEIIRQIPGVISTEVGYTGGKTKNPTYKTLKGSNHAEAVEIVFDANILSFEELLLWFFRMHDPTTKNRQGNDVGPSYRSAIFFTSPEQEKIARKVIKKVDAAKHYPRPIVTEVTKATKFTAAEDYHQDYLQKNPKGYTCHFLREWDWKD